jgi:hypothetical protein
MHRGGSHFLPFNYSWLSNAIFPAALQLHALGEEEV